MHATAASVKHLHLHRCRVQGASRELIECCEDVQHAYGVQNWAAILANIE
jgi:hypothetical protein